MRIMQGSLKPTFFFFTAITLLLCSHINAAELELEFDFSRTRGDRQHYFGTHYPAGGFDDNRSAGSFQVQGKAQALLARSAQRAWLLLDDVNPDQIDKTPAEDLNALKAGDVLVRTRLSNLSSGDVGQVGAAGVMLGASVADGQVANAVVCLVDRNPGPNTGTLRIEGFAAGDLTDLLAESDSFRFGASNAIYFLEVAVVGQTCTVKLFADDTIAGKGADVARLVSGDFATAEPVANVSVQLPEPAAGLLGVYYEDPEGGKDGGVHFHNFYVSKAE